MPSDGIRQMNVQHKTRCAAANCKADSWRKPGKYPYINNVKKKGKNDEESAKEKNIYVYFTSTYEYTFL